ncbi:MAG: hypothetical protein IKJ18_03815 [Bacteroidaceae bacterium]|nr:hypothetical protein [Bacteroidaceae bacterium]
MDKRTYIKPEAVEIQLESEQIMSASNFNPASGNDYDGSDAGATGRRGTWGNLWAEE